MADETAQVEDTGPRTIDELVDLPYSEMTEEEIDMLVEWKAANKARDDEHQRRMDALQAHFAEEIAIHRQAAAESKAVLDNLTAAALARLGAEDGA